MDRAGLQSSLERIMKAYPFDALSHYLAPPLSPVEHLKAHRRGHCLDLAVALFYEVGGRVIGLRRQGAPFCHHYTLIVPTLEGEYWLDPSIGVCAPLNVGERFYPGGKPNVIERVGDGCVELLIEENRRVVLAYEPVVNLMTAQRQIHHTRKDLTLRYEGVQIRYLWRQARFEWGERLFLPDQLTAAEQEQLSVHFACNIPKLLETFLFHYRHIPDDFWHWEI